MKKIVTLGLILCSLSTTLKSQDVVSVERSIYGIQTGTLGVWVHGETMISQYIALRTELGLDMGFVQQDFNANTVAIMAPVISLEPRWYYNLNKREAKSKRVDNNNGNFLSLQASFHPDWFVISSVKDIRIVSDLSIIPTWGIRRSLGKHFVFETGIGLGYIRFFIKKEDLLQGEEVDDFDLNLHLRIGYQF